MALNLIMLGPPGAGKGTQAERLARARGIPKISTGDILREAANAGTEIGLRAKETMDRGGLVSDDVMIDIVGERLARPDAAGGFILDGFPRTVPQAEALDRMVAGRGPLVVIDLVVPEFELVRRLQSRLICADCGATVGAFAGHDAQLTERVIAPAAVPAVEGEPVPAAVRAQTEPRRCRRCGGPLVQRADDEDLVVLQRLKVYLRETRPLVEYYQARPTFRVVNGMQTPERVAAELNAALESAAHAVRGETR